MEATEATRELLALARRIADAYPEGPGQELVVTGSVSRGVADELSDIEMLVVTREPLALEDCYGLARAAGLDGLDTWTFQGLTHQLPEIVLAYEN